MAVLGLGHDVVDVAAFTAQLETPGTAMLRLFSLRERRQAAARAQRCGDGEALHLAARWAGKEAVIKAWCDAAGDGPLPYTPDSVPWSGIEIVCNARGVPQVHLAPSVAANLASSVQGDACCAANLASSVSAAASTATVGSSSPNPSEASPTPDPSEISPTPNPSEISPTPNPSEASLASVPLAPARSSPVPPHRPAPSLSWRLSLSHDGPIASAVALLCCR